MDRFYRRGKGVGAMVAVFGSFLYLPIRALRAGLEEKIKSLNKQGI